MTDKHTNPGTYEGPRSTGRIVGKLWYDKDENTGDVTVTAYFGEKMDPLRRLDALKDWIGMLEREYEVQHRIYFGDASKKRNMPK